MSRWHAYEDSIGVKKTLEAQRERGGQLVIEINKDIDRYQEFPIGNGTLSKTADIFDCQCCSWWHISAASLSVYQADRAAMLQFHASRIALGGFYSYNRMDFMSIWERS